MSIDLVPDTSSTTQEVVELLSAEVEAKEYMNHVAPVVGDRVLVLEGPWKDSTGQVSKLDPPCAWVEIDSPLAPRLPGDVVDITKVKRADLQRLWPGLDPGENPQGGWKKLMDNQAKRNPQPCVGQVVRPAEWPNDEGQIVIIHEGLIGHTAPEADQLLWSAPSDLELKHLDRDEWMSYAPDVKSIPATLIESLPEPFCNIRSVTRVDGRWVALDGNMNPIAHIQNESDALNLLYQSFWEFRGRFWQE